MEITNEIKAKVFAQYLGQMVEVYNGDSKGLPRKLIAVGGIDDEEYVKLRLGSAGSGQFVHACFIRNNECKLILKPLSAITDEDAIEVQKIIGFMANKKFKQFFEICNATSPETAIEIYQFLQSKGYDMPHYLLGGKTLEEVGLAIYENNQAKSS